MEDSKIGWTDHTFNPWIGCDSVGAGCKNCYAKEFANRFTNKLGNCWGVGATRYITSDSYWAKPLTWNRKAAAAGKRAKVFCASLADIFDVDGPADARERLWALIRRTPHLDWLILTKRPNNFKRYLPADWGEGYENVWLGVTCENRIQGYPRVDALRRTPAKVRFVSCEPLLEDVSTIDLTGIDWVIVGGESGKSPAALRQFDIAWVRSLKVRCEEMNIMIFVKQLGNVPVENGILYQIAQPDLAKAANSHGSNLECFPADLQVQQRPNAEPLVPTLVAPGPSHCAVSGKAERQSIAAKKAWETRRRDATAQTPHPHNHIHTPSLVTRLTGNAVAAGGLPIESFKATMAWLEDFQDEPIIGHMAQSAHASMEGMIMFLGAIQEGKRVNVKEILPPRPR